ncbi:MAG: peptidoglycan-binding domain-containing protein [Bacteroidota bacterium]
MKRLFYIIMIIGIPIIVFFQYQKWTKFSTPNQYDYSASDQIDNHYFDQSLVKLYYQNCAEIGSYARSVWYTDGIDVKNYDQNDGEIKRKAIYYEFLVAQTKMIEKKLEESKSLKQKGLNNQEIKVLFETGISLQEQQKEILINSYAEVQFGEISQKVFEIQKRLTDLGYSLPIDGNFRNSTQETIRRFQSENNLAPTGLIDLKTSQELFK